MKYHFKIHREKAGFWAECLELDGCVTQADNRETNRVLEQAQNTYDIPRN
jgi:predicted RNase H-like HicB family nuclease